MGRILSIDYGRKRTGIAVTDPLQIIAQGLTTVATAELSAFLKDYVAREKVDLIVVGRPIQPNGQPSENLKRVETFVASTPVSRNASHLVGRAIYFCHGSSDHA